MIMRAVVPFLYAISLCATAGDSVVNKICGEWKGHDGNLHVITDSSWIITLPNGLKKERKFEVPWIAETKGFWIKVSPVESFFFLLTADNKVTCIGPRRDSSGAYVNSPDVFTILEEGKLRPADAQKLLATYNAKKAADAPRVARTRLKNVCHSIASSMRDVEQLESEIDSIKKNPPPPSKFIIEAIGSEERAKEQNKVYLESRIKDYEFRLKIAKETLAEAQMQLNNLRQKSADITDKELADELERARQQLR